MKYDGATQGVTTRFTERGLLVGDHDRSRYVDPDEPDYTWERLEEIRAEVLQGSAALPDQYGGEVAGPDNGKS